MTCMQIWTAQYLNYNVLRCTRFDFSQRQISIVKFSGFLVVCPAKEFSRFLRNFGTGYRTAWRRILYYRHLNYDVDIGNATGLVK